MGTKPILVISLMAGSGQIEACDAIDLEEAGAIGSAALSQCGDIEHIVEREVGILGLDACRAGVTHIETQAHTVLGSNPVAKVELSLCSCLGMAGAHEVETSTHINEEVVKGMLAVILLGHPGTLQHIVERTALELGT